MARLAERGSNALLLRDVRGTIDRESARRTIADALPPLLASIFQPPQLDLIREGFQRLPESETRPRLTGRDWLGALGVCILVILSTFPVVIPFLVFDNVQTALRISNHVSVLLKRGLRITMTQLLLHNSERCPTFKKLARCRVTEGVSSAVSYAQ